MNATRSHLVLLRRGLVGACVGLSMCYAGRAQANVWAYVTNTNSNVVQVADIDANAIITSIPVGAVPVDIKASPAPDFQYVYVTNRGSNTVSVIDTNANAVVATIPVGSAPEGLALSPDGSRLYVANSYDNTISVIDTASRSVRAQVPCENFPSYIAVAPSGNPMYVTNRTSGTMAVIDTVTLKQINQVEIWRYAGIDSITGRTKPCYPWYIALSPDGTIAYITDVNAGVLYLVSTVTGAVSRSVFLGAAPWGVLANADPGNPSVYTVNTDDGVLTYLQFDGTISKTVSLGTTQYPHGLALSPHYNSLLVTIGSSLNWYRVKASSPRPDGGMSLGGSPRAVTTILKSVP